MKEASEIVADGCGSATSSAAKGAGACTLTLRSYAFRGVSDKLPSRNTAGVPGCLSDELSAREVCSFSLLLAFFPLSLSLMAL